MRGTTKEVASIGIAVTSITFVTNKKTYGPYGSVTGANFESARHGKIMGFFGRVTTCVQSFGVLAEIEDLPDVETVTVQEAWGGHGGEPFYDGRGDVLEVVVSYNDEHIVSLQATYKHGDKVFVAKEHGGQNGRGPKLAKVKIVRQLVSYFNGYADCPVLKMLVIFNMQITLQPDEYLIQIKGSSHKYHGSSILESLEFISNKQTYGPFGAAKPHGQVKSTQKLGKIVGFFGKAGWYLDQLGVIISFPSEREDLLLCQGPWGGRGGIAFSDGRGEISEVSVKYSKSHIISLQVTYDQSNTKFESRVHGNAGNDSGDSKKVRQCETSKLSEALSFSLISQHSILIPPWWLCADITQKLGVPGPSEGNNRNRNLR